MNETRDRFEKHFIPVTESGCYLWTACIDGRKGSGYGRFNWNGGIIYAHRASWMIYKGPIPKGKNVLHKCDTPLCVNPSHLFLGTHKDNMADRSNKGRGKNNPALGEESHLTKLTKKEVIEIFSDNRKQYVIAEEYGVTQPQVSCIKLGKTWKHLNLTGART